MVKIPTMTTYVSSDLPPFRPAKGSEFTAHVKSRFDALLPQYGRLWKSMADAAPSPKRQGGSLQKDSSNTHQALLEDKENVDPSSASGKLSLSCDSSSGSYCSGDDICEQMKAMELSSEKTPEKTYVATPKVMCEIQPTASETKEEASLLGAILNKRPVTLCVSGDLCGDQCDCAAPVLEEDTTCFESPGDRSDGGANDATGGIETIDDEAVEHTQIETIAEHVAENVAECDAESDAESVAESIVESDAESIVESIVESSDQSLDVTTTNTPDEQRHSQDVSFGTEIVASSDESSVRSQATSEATSEATSVEDVDVTPESEQDAASTSEEEWEESSSDDDDVDDQNGSRINTVIILSSDEEDEEEYQDEEDEEDEEELEDDDEEDEYFEDNDEVQVEKVGNVGDIELVDELGDSDDEEDNHSIEIDSQDEIEEIEDSSVASSTFIVSDEYDSDTADLSTFQSPPKLSRETPKKLLSKSSSNNGSRRNTNHKTNLSFRKHRESLTRRTFSEFNHQAFHNALSSIEVSWSKKLNTTAGITRLRGIPGDPATRVARIELATKVIDNEDKLRSTLMHEMCHGAAWLVDGVLKPPHGECFKKWASIAMKRVEDVEVTTTHDYQIAYKYAWACSSPNCNVIIQRHSRSIDINRHCCGRCKNSLIEIEVPGSKKDDSNIGYTPKKGRREASGFALYVKQNSTEVRKILAEERKCSPKEICQADVMKECGRFWKREKNGLENGGNVGNDLQMMTDRLKHISIGQETE